MVTLFGRCWGRATLEPAVAELVEASKRTALGVFSTNFLLLKRIMQNSKLKGEADSDIVVTVS